MTSLNNPAIRRLSDKLKDDYHNIETKLKKDEKFIEEIYKLLIEDAKRIGQLIVNNNYSTLVENLISLTKELEYIKEIICSEKDKKIIKNFIEETAYLAKTLKQSLNDPSYTNNEEKLKAFKIALSNLLKRTVLKDLHEEHKKLDKLLKEIIL